MESIRQAVERARNLAAPSVQQSSARYHAPEEKPQFPLGAANGIQPEIQEVVLNNAHLQANRIVAQNVADPLTRSFDMLRTQVLQAMDAKDSKILAITSPTQACGKTVTALNLALSIARQPERSALLVDLDFQKPKVAASLGIKLVDDGALGVLEGRTSLSKAVIPARAGNQRLMVLPTKQSSGSSELMASRAMAAMLQDLRNEFRSYITIVDLPPILSSDDVIAILPQIDCVLLVVAVGTSTVAQIEECNRHLVSAEVVRVVLNKVPQTATQYYY